LEEHRQALRSVLRLSLSTVAEGGETMALKQQANEAYGRGGYRKAVGLYTQALARCDAASEVAVLLNNKAQCQLASNAQHDAVALACASLRLQGSEKARYRAAQALMELGEFDLAAAAEPGRQHRCEQLASEARAEGKFVLDLAKEQGDWVGAVEVAPMPGKGRGLRATRDLAEQEVLLVERHRVLARKSGKTGESICSTNHKTRLITTETQLRLVSLISAAAKTDALLAATVHALSDGSCEDLPIVQLPMLLNRLSPLCLPLLGQDPHFVPQEERIQLPYAKVEGVVSINCHGDGEEEGRLTRAERFFGGGCTMLYPASSMINHSSSPNSYWVHVASGVQATVALRSIKAGEEVTASYRLDASKVGNKWGITS